ncbi:hypothetical protein CR513_51404, partial [Mucuna pruriens]
MHFYDRKFKNLQTKYSVIDNSYFKHLSSLILKANRRHFDQLKSRSRLSPPSHPVETEGVSTN